MNDPEGADAWPHSFQPQQSTEPSDRTPHEWASPADTWMNEADPLPAGDEPCCQVTALESIIPLLASTCSPGSSDGTSTGDASAVSAAVTTEINTANAATTPTTVLADTARSGEAPSLVTVVLPSHGRIARTECLGFADPWGAGPRIACWSVCTLGLVCNR